MVADRLKLVFVNITFASILGLSCSSPPLQKAIVPSDLAARYYSEGKSVAVATQGAESSQVGSQVLASGGNAVDAAVAISFALGVERPFSTGIGGGGFFVLAGVGLETSPDPVKSAVKSAQSKGADALSVVALDAREMAPLASTENMYLNRDGNPSSNRSVDGAKAAAVPGLVAGLWELHRKYGSKPWSELLSAAIRMADEGVPMTALLREVIEDDRDRLWKDPIARARFFQNSQGQASNKDSRKRSNPGEPLPEGAIIRQPELADTLRLIAARGRDGFYRGTVATAIVRSQRVDGGIMTTRDLISYRPKWREPLKGAYKDWSLYSMPPPSSGGVHVLQILNLAKGWNLSRTGNLHHPENIHRIASAMQIAFRDRAEFLGDNDFVKVPVAELTSQSHADSIRSQLGGRAVPAPQLQPSLVMESDETTHFSIVDNQGWMLASTQTINGWFGNGQNVAGFFMNNEMDDFSIKAGVANMYGAVGNSQNSIQPRKRPLSSMSPTIAVRNGQPVLALGSPNGTRIISCVALTLLQRMEFGESLKSSIETIRFHQQWVPDELRLESALPASTHRALEARGHELKVDPYACSVQAVEIENGMRRAVSDPRDAMASALAF